MAADSGAAASTAAADADAPAETEYTLDLLVSSPFVMNRFNTHLATTDAAKMPLLEFMYDHGRLVTTRASGAPVSVRERLSSSLTQKSSPIRQLYSRGRGRGAAPQADDVLCGVGDLRRLAVSAERILEPALGGRLKKADVTNLMAIGELANLPARGRFGLTVDDDRAVLDAFRLMPSGSTASGAAPKKAAKRSTSAASSDSDSSDDEGSGAGAAAAIATKLECEGLPAAVLRQHVAPLLGEADVVRFGRTCRAAYLAMAAPATSVAITMPADREHSAMALRHVRARLLSIAKEAGTDTPARSAETVAVPLAPPIGVSLSTARVAVVAADGCDVGLSSFVYRLTAGCAAPAHLLAPSGRRDRRLSGPLSLTGVPDMRLDVQGFPVSQWLVRAGASSSRNGSGGGSSGSGSGGGGESGFHCVVLLYSTSSVASLAALSGAVAEPPVQAALRHCAVAVVGNKTDFIGRETARVVDADALADSVAGMHFEVSAHDGSGVAQLTNALVVDLLSRQGSGGAARRKALEAAAAGGATASGAAAGGKSGRGKKGGKERCAVM